MGKEGAHMTTRGIFKRSVMVAVVAPLAMLMLAGFATAAAAQGTAVFFGVYFCPAGSTVSTVIDGEPTQEGPFVADSFDSVEATVTVPDGVLGNVLVATCAGVGTVATVISSVPPGTFCPNPDNSNVANYVPPPGQLCMKVFSVAGSGAGDRVGADIVALVSNGADSGNRLTAFFAARNGAIFTPPEPPARSVGLATTTSGQLARAAVAGVAAVGLGAFTLRRRKIGATT